MSVATQELLLAASDVRIEAAADKTPAVNILAYAGGLMSVPGWGPLVIDLAGSSILNSWIVYMGARYHVRLGAGVTAVMAPDFYQFLQTGQLAGQLSGMKGAAEYEQLVVERGYAPAKGLASRAMNAISASHLLLIALIVMGNVGYFAARRAKPKNPQGGA